MTPIKVGDYTVEDARGAYRYWGRYVVLNARGECQWAPIRGKRGDVLRSCVFHKLPFALRVAARLAGIERQRVVVHRSAYDNSTYHALITRSHDWLDYRETYDLSESELVEIGDVAHEYATARYAALTNGGAA